MGARVAFLFPGQGVLPERLPPLTPAIEELFAHAASRGLPLRRWIEDQDTDRLFATEAAQPAILIDGLARDASLRAAGRSPDLVAGHSLGEYPALVSAGVLGARDALDLVIERGKLMSNVAGAMTAIVKLDLDTVTRLCDEIGPEVVVANHNGTRQVVVSGTTEATGRLAAAAEAIGGRGIPLKVSGPFHSPFMQDACAALADRIDRMTFRTPTVPVVCSVSGRVERDPDRLRQLLRKQMTACVRWVDVLERLAEEGVEFAIESGPGNVLTGLGRRHTTAIEFQTYEEAVHGTIR
jgi:[acyl-carrier-protein] S-malonyltransferase